jgi:transcriptional regulator with XRE-family HTH domain
MPKKPPENQEIQRILDVTQTLLRVLDLSNREIERRLGLSPSYLTRVFTGYVEVKLEHVLDIAQAMGLSPAEFFSFVYPDVPEPLSPAAQKIRSRLAQLQPAKPDRSKELELLMEQHKRFLELIEARAGKTASEK